MRAMVKLFHAELNLAEVTIFLRSFHFPRCVYVEEGPSFDEAVYPSKRLEIAFT
jgi:hypothetical protein